MQEYASNPLSRFADSHNVAEFRNVVPAYWGLQSRLLNADVGDPVGLGNLDRSAAVLGKCVIRPRFCSLVLFPLSPQILQEFNNVASNRLDIHGSEVPKG